MCVAKVSTVLAFLIVGVCNSLSAGIGFSVFGIPHGGVGSTAIRSVAFVKGSKAWDIDNYWCYGLRFNPLIVNDKSAGKNEIIALWVEISRLSITGSHKEQFSLDLNSEIESISFIFDLNILKYKTSTGILFGLGPGISFCQIDSKYTRSYYLLLRSGPSLSEANEIKECGGEVYWATPLFVDINLSRSLWNHFYLRGIGRLGLVTLFESLTAKTYCGVHEENFPCPNTGINLSASLEFIW